MSIKFFGASVIGVSASLGFNNQPSSLKVSLVEDLRGGDSFVVPTVGTPATFTIGSFTFGGLIQQWRKNRSTSGNPLYEINLVDPRELLEGVQVILSGYSGSVGISNVLNVYGYHESVAFGNAMVNDSGMSWNLIKSAVQTLTSGASGSYGGPIKLKGYSYAVDLSELPDAPSTFRIGGSVTMSLLEIINTVADAGGFDVYFTLNGSTIRVNKIDRYNQPPLGAMSAYVDQQAQAGNSPGANVGVEFRNETVASMVIGGPVELLHLTSNIVPYWGLDHEGNVIVGTGTGDNHTAELNSSSVSDITGSLSYSCKVEEMRMALFHQGMWVAYICANKPELAQILQFVPGMQINKALENIFARRHLINGKAGIDPKAAIDSDILMKQTRMYEFVKTQAETYYGKKYLVQLPDVQYRIEPDTLRTITSYEIGNAGYLPEGSQPLGLEEAQSDIFQDGESRYQPFARYGNSQDIMFQSIDPAGSWVKTDDNAEFGFEALFIKSETDPLIYIAQGQPKAVLTINRPPFIKSNPQRVFDFDAATKIFPAENRAALKAAFERAAKEDNFGNDIRIGQFFAYATPEAVAVPLKSNISVYGPWYAHEVDGKVSVNNNPALTPWNFNGYSLLNQAGANESWGSVTKLQDHESGSIELAGVPTISLGGKLSEQGSNITSMDITYDAGQGYKTNYRFETFTPRFGTLSKIAQKRIETLARTQGQLSRQAKKIARDNKIKQAILQGAQQAFWENLNKKWKDGTPHDIFMGKIFTESDNTNFSSVSVATLEEVAGTLDKDSTKYQQCAAMSMDGLIRPFSTRNNDTYLPSYVAPSGISNGLTRDNLNPFIEDNDLAIHAHGNTNTGLLATQADPDNSRLFALRGPLVVAGWGYDLDGNVAPAFVNKQQKMSHWNAGPVDLLWDQYRGVWSCNNRKIGKANADITAGSTGNASIWDGSSDLGYDLDVTNWSNNVIPSGQNILLNYIPEANSWFTLGSSGTIVNPQQYDGTNLTITSASISTNQNNYAAPTTNILNINATANFRFTGFSLGISGKVFELINTGNYTITLPHEDSSSSSSNQISTPNGYDWKIPPKTSVLLKYIGSKWHIADIPYLPASHVSASVRSITGNDTLTREDCGRLIKYEGAGGHTLTLFDLDSTTYPNDINYRFSVRNLGTGTLTIDGAGSETIDNSTALVYLHPGQGLDIFSDGTAWYTQTGRPPTGVTEINSSPYNITSADNGKMLVWRGAGTLVLNESPGLPSGMRVHIRNLGSSQDSMIEYTKIGGTKEVLPPGWGYDLYAPDGMDAGTSSYAQTGCTIFGVRKITSNYTLSRADNNRMIEYEGSGHTLTLFAINSAVYETDGVFACCVRNLGTGTLVVTPNGSQHLNNANTSITLFPCQSVWLYCDGTEWYTETGRSCAGLTEISSSPYSITAADHGKLLIWTGAGTLVLNESPGLPQGLRVGIKNAGLSQDSMIEYTKIGGTKEVLPPGWGYDLYSPDTMDAGTTAHAMTGVTSFGVRKITSNDSLKRSDANRLIEYEGSGATLTLFDLDSATYSTDAVFAFAVRNLGTGTLTVTPAGADTINNTTSLRVDPCQGTWIFTDGTEWYTVPGIPCPQTGTSVPSHTAPIGTRYFKTDTGTNYYNTDGGTTWATGTGTVTSVGLSAPSIFTVTGSPVTTTGTLTFTYNGAQGDILYADSASSLAKLAKNTIATRYLANTGTNNNPDWSQVDLNNGVTNVLPIANGGTNSSTSLNNNRIMQSSGGSIIEVAAITAARALISDANGIPTHSAVTSTELGYLTGVTSSVQTQLNNKQATGNYITALTGDVTAAGPGSVAATIASQAVTFAKIQNIATDSLIGRDSSGTGSPENITLNSTLEMTGSSQLQRAALTGDVSASAGSNVTTIEDGVITNSKIVDNTIDLTTKVTNTLPIGNGGTNSSVSLNNNRIMVSSAGAIVEASALTNGQLLIGSTGAAPVAANIVAENGIYITNAAGSITIGKRAEGGLDSYAVNGGFDVVQRYDPTISNVIADGDYGPDRWKIQRENADVEYERKDAVSETSLQSRYYGRFKKITNAGKVFICQILSHQESMKFKGQICLLQAAMRSNASRSVRIAIYEWLGTADSVDTSISAWGGAGVAPTFTSLDLVPYTPINNNSVTTSWSLFYWGLAFITTSVKNIVFAIYTDDDMSVNDTLDIAQVTLLIDTTAFTDSWQPAPEEIVLKQCQKYYQKSFDVDAKPEENAGTGSDELNWQSTVGSSSTSISPRINFNPPMRTAPTVTLYNPSSANAEVRDETAAADCSASSAFNVTKNGFNITTTTPGGGAAGDLLSVNWSASAEL